MNISERPSFPVNPGSNPNPFLCILYVQGNPFMYYLNISKDGTLLRQPSPSSFSEYSMNALERNSPAPLYFFMLCRVE